jgi:hypothetical protein
MILGVYIEQIQRTGSLIYVLQQKIDPRVSEE